MNRFIVSQLAHLGAWNWVAGPIKLNPIRDTRTKYMVYSEKDGKEKAYDIVVERHGPKPPWLEAGFPSIWKACLKLKERWELKPKHLDFTRKPLLWKEVFSLPDEIDEVGTRPRPERYRLVAFDLDGTLLRGKNYKWSWKLVWKHLNYNDAVRGRLMAEYVNQKRHTHKDWYKEWCDRSARLFRIKRLKRTDFTAITKGLVPVDGLRETLQALKQDGIKLAIVSGGIYRCIPAREDSGLCRVVRLCFY